MPIRTTRKRRDPGLRRYIVPIYTRPVMKFLYDPDYEQLKDLIYGLGTRPPKGTGARGLWNQRAEALRPLWSELREDILSAQQEYMPDKKPWGCRFE